ncbi:hypothetical protein HZC20_01195 [Candidatus Peregrinibacteria bacterium]|nr:hypothetical protein [Candidatus Peregrinibacteria bacterium]
MDREQRKVFAFGIILALIVILSVVYFLWGNLINRGYIEITGTAPFVVEVFESQIVECGASPCEIKETIGSKNLILSKEGYKKMIKTVKVSLFGKTRINADFEIIPFLQSAESMPKDEEKIDYELVLDKDTQMTKLINKKDSSKTTIVFFPKSLKTPKIFGSKKSILIMDFGGSTRTAYRVDAILKSKDKIENFDFTEIENGVWSDTGKYFVFTKSDSQNLWLMDGKNKITKLNLLKDGVLFAWGAKDSLFFATSMSFQNATTKGKYGDYYINLLPEKSKTKILFGIYHPDENAYTSIGDFDEIKSLPDKMIPLGNEKAVYFKIKDKIFKLVNK